MKQLRVVIFENGLPSSAEYANELFDSLNVEASVVNVYDKRPATQILPVRAIPNVAVLLFADTMEEGQKIVDIVRQLEFFQNQEEIEAIGDILTDEQAVQNKIIYPRWAPDMVCYDGTDPEHPQVTKVRGNEADDLYKCISPHTAQAGWEPEITPALWAKINEFNAGTLEDPIPAARGMEYEYGKYYFDPEDEKIYLCERGAETGTIVLQYLPHEVIGNYFTLAE